MAEPIFDKEGNLTNLSELTVEEVSTAYQTKNKDVFNRMTEAETREKQAKADKEKAEQDLVAEKKKNEPPKVEPKATPDISDELRLFAKGLSEAEIEEAKSIAKGKDISLVEASKTKTFLLFQADLKEEQRKEAAKLGASHGSGSEGEKPSVTSGMTTEQHKEAWNKANGIE